MILDVSWFSTHVIGPLLAPDTADFRISLRGLCESGPASKDLIQRTLEKWIKIDETIDLLCNLEICYPLPEHNQACISGVYQRRTSTPCMI